MSPAIMVTVGPSPGRLGASIHAEARDNEICAVSLGGRDDHPGEAGLLHHHHPDKSRVGGDKENDGSVGNGDANVTRGRMGTEDTTAVDGGDNGSVMSSLTDVDDAAPDGPSSDDVVVEIEIEEEKCEGGQGRYEPPPSPPPSPPPAPAPPQNSILVTDDDPDRQPSPATALARARRSSALERAGPPPETPKEPIVTFSEVEIRKYDVTMGDNPCCSYGPPIMLDWTYDVDDVVILDLDVYEATRAPRRLRQFMLLNYYQRRDLLVAAGFTVEEIKRWTREVNKVRFQRKVTVYFLPATRVGEAVYFAAEKMCAAAREKKDDDDMLMLEGLPSPGQESAAAVMAPPSIKPPMKAVLKRLRSKDYDDFKSDGPNSAAAPAKSSLRRRRSQTKKKTPAGSAPAAAAAVGAARPQSVEHHQRQHQHHQQQHHQEDEGGVARFCTLRLAPGGGTKNHHHHPPATDSAHTFRTHDTATDSDEDEHGHGHGHGQSPPPSPPNDNHNHNHHHNDPYAASSDSKFTDYGLQVDRNQHDRATEIMLCSLRRPHMRAFHASWFGFFAAFFLWFAITPLLGEVRSSLNLTNDEIWMSSLAGTAGTIVTRLVMGPACDRFGARLCMAFVLAAGAIPTALTGLVQTSEGLSVLRLFIGIAGGSFVACQFWTSSMFIREVAGTANALAAGWGNLGGGVAQVVMGSALFPLFKVIYGGTSGETTEEEAADKAWRTVCVIPAVVALITAGLIWAYCDDSPKGNYLDRVREQDLLEAAPFESLCTVAFKANAWLLSIQYACCFGVEVTMTNATALYFRDQFGQTTETAAAIASIFGFMNLFARGLGGYCSDSLNHRGGMRGRLLWQFVALLLQGVCLIIFGFSNTMAGAIVALVATSLFVQSSEGSTFGIVPYVYPRFTGGVVGMVGAGGNVGGVAFAAIFRAYTYRESFMYMGLAVVGSSFLSFLVRIKGRDSFLVCKGRDQEMYQFHRAPTREDVVKVDPPPPPPQEQQPPLQQQPQQEASVDNV